MKVQFKKINKKAITPKYSYIGDAAMDLTAISREFVETEEYFHVVYKTGISIQIPKGYVGLIFPRSSIANYNLLLCNSVGVIDSNYRGEIILKFTIDTEFYRDEDGVLKGIEEYVHKNIPIKLYEEGDRIGQLLIISCPEIELEEVKELCDTNRGIKGFGSSGK